MTATSDGFVVEFDEPPMVWLSRLGLRVVELRIAPDEGEFAFVVDRDDSIVVSDQLASRGDPKAEALLIAMRDNRIAYRLVCYGDCCSESWLADVVGVDVLLGERVVDARTIELPDHLSADIGPDDKPRTRQEYDEVYGWEVVTRKGVCTLAMRNSSNGYYGGSLYFAGFFSLDGMADWRVVTEDWSA